MAEFGVSGIIKRQLVFVNKMWEEGGNDGGWVAGEDR